MGPSPSRKSIFSPVDQILKLNLVSGEEDEENLSPKEQKKRGKNIPNDILHGNIDMIRMDNQKISIQKSDDLNSNLKYSKNIFNSPSVLLKRKDKNAQKVSEFNLEDNLVKMDDFNLDEDLNKDPVNDAGKKNVEKSDKKSQVLFEDWIYKLS